MDYKKLIKITDGVGSDARLQEALNQYNQSRQSIQNSEAGAEDLGTRFGNASSRFQRVLKELGLRMTPLSRKGNPVFIDMESGRRFVLRNGKRSYLHEGDKGQYLGDPYDKGRDVYGNEGFDPDDYIRENDEDITDSKITDTFDSDESLPYLDIENYEATEG